MLIPARVWRVCACVRACVCVHSCVCACALGYLMNPFPVDVTLTQSYLDIWCQDPHERIGILDKDISDNPQLLDPSKITVTRPLDVDIKTAW